MPAGALILKRWNDFIKRAAEELPELAIAASQQAMEFALDHLMDNLPPRPPSDTAKANWKGFLTDRSRRWFFWALKSGELERIKRATKPLYPGFYTEAHVIKGEGTIGILANDRPYAPWVVGPDYAKKVVYGGLNGGKPMYQARIHQNRWWQLSTYIEGESKNVWDIFNKELMETLGKSYQLLMEGIR